MLDMIQPRIPGKISLGDLKRCRMTPIFFDTFFNLEKYLDHEQKDPFASQRVSITVVGNSLYLSSRLAFDLNAFNDGRDDVSGPRC